MIGVWTILLGNALPAAGLALVAFIVSRIIRRPALTHLLWILVLLKLVTPPLLPWSISISAETAQTIGLPAPSNIEADETPASQPIPRTRISDSPFESTVDGNPAMVPASVADEKSRWAGAGAPQSSKSAPWWRRHGTLILVLIWTGGSALMALFLLRLLLGIRRQFEPAYVIDPGSQQRVQELAERLGIARAPDVRIVNGVVSPLLWGVGRFTTIIFPRTLWEELPASSRDALLLHELAHFRRGDQWVRLLEIVVGCLYWWHPCVWWARRELAAAEEECCDAWVVRHAGHQPRSYAEAIITTLDYLAGDPVHRRVVTTGANTMPVLRRRLQHIMHRTVSPSLPQPVAGCVVMAASVMLPLQPLLEVLPRNTAEAAVLMTAGEQFRQELIALPDRRVTTISAPAIDIDLLPPSPQGWWSTRPQSSVAVFFSPAQRFVIERRDNYDIRVVDRATDTAHNLTDANITCLVFTPDGERFVTGSEDGAIRLWDAEEGRPVNQVGQMDGRVTSIDVSPDGTSVVSGSEAGSILMWEISSGAVQGEWTSAEEEPIVCVRMKDGGIIASVGHWSRLESGHIVILDAATWEAIDLVRTGRIIAAIETDSADNDSLLLSDYSGHVWSWTANNRTGTALGKVGKSDVLEAAFSSAYRLSTRL